MTAGAVVGASGAEGRTGAAAVSEEYFQKPEPSLALNKD